MKMTVENDNVGVETEPTPETQSRYADYYELNADESKEAGSSEDKEEVSTEEPVGDKSEEVAPEPESLGSDESTDETAKDSDKPSEGKKSGWQRSVDRLTRQRNSEREKNAKLADRIKELESQKPKETKVSKDSYLTDEEYQDARLEAKLEDKLAEKDRQSEISRLKQETESSAAEGFGERWHIKVEEAFPDPEMREDYNKLINSVDYTPSKDVHEFLDDSVKGPQILAVLKANETVRSQVENSGMLKKASLLGQIEANLMAMDTESPEQPKETTQAPNPTGDVSSSSDAVSGDDANAVDQYYRRKYGS
jgi:hypothetical protein